MNYGLHFNEEHLLARNGLHLLRDVFARSLQQTQKGYKLNPAKEEDSIPVARETPSTGIKGNKCWTRNWGGGTLGRWSPKPEYSTFKEDRYSSHRENSAMLYPAHNYICIMFKHYSGWLTAIKYTTTNSSPQEHK